MYVQVKERQPAPIPTPVEIQVARGDQSVQDEKVQEHLKSLLKTAEEMTALLDMVRMCGA